MLRRVALVRTDVSEERSASMIRVTRIGELGITLAVTSNRSTLRRDTILFFVDNVRTSTEKHLRASTACYAESFTFLYVIDVRTSQQTHLWACTACYVDSFTFFVDDVRNSKETYLRASAACYGESYTLFFFNLQGKFLLHMR
jgi:hypothetical protein